jgi:hypothetical protein
MQVFSHTTHAIVRSIVASIMVEGKLWIPHLNWTGVGRALGCIRYYYVEFLWLTICGQLLLAQLMWLKRIVSFP